MGRIRTKLPSRRIVAMIGVVVAFFAVAAPSCRDYNGGGPSDAIYVLRVSPAVVCRDGMYVVLVRELRDASAGQAWDGGRDDRITVFRGSAAQFQTNPLAVIADRPVDFAIDNNPAAVWPGFVPRFPEIVGDPAVARPFAVATIKLPWQSGVRLATGESIVGQTYTDEILYQGIPFEAPPLGRPPLSPTEIVQPTDPYFDLDPTSVPYSRVARIFPGLQDVGYPTWEDPADVDEEVPTTADNCWLFPLTASVDIRPGVNPNVINPASATPVPVAVLSTPTFNATQIAPSTLRVGPTGVFQSAPAASSGTSDVDHDGDVDLLATFVPNQTGLRCGGTSLSVRGGLVDGPPFNGASSVVTAPCA